MIELSNENVRIVVNPLGAELTELTIGSTENLLWKPNNIHWNRVAPHLFPIVGRLKNNEFKVDEKTFQMTQHGFARDEEFSLVEKSSSSLIFELESTEKTKEKYPFDFSFRVHYILKDNGVEVVYETSNLGKTDMYYSVGAHPGFQLNDDLEHCYLAFDKNGPVERQVLKNAHYNGETEHVSIPEKWYLSDDLFEEDAFVVFNPAFKTIELGHRTKGKLVKLSTEKMTAIGFWTRKGAPFFCIEPWWGYADMENASGVLSEKTGIRRLKVGESEMLSYSIYL